MAKRVDRVEEIPYNKLTVKTGRCPLCGGIWELTTYKRRLLEDRCKSGCWAFATTKYKVIR